MALTLAITARRDDFVLEVTLEVGAGITAVVGPSGAGKSTLLGVIAGLVPSEGTMRLGDEVWLDSRAGLLLAPERRRVGLVLQSLALFPHLDVRGNVGYGLRHLPAQDREARVVAALTRASALHLVDRRPSKLSGGEAQRVALARAAAIEPRVLLLDEPFSALDRPLRKTLGDETAAFARDLGVPCILVTHDLEEAARLADRSVELVRGKIVPGGVS